MLGLTVPHLTPLHPVPLNRPPARRRMRAQAGLSQTLPLKNPLTQNPARSWTVNRMSLQPPSRVNGWVNSQKLPAAKILNSSKIAAAAKIPNSSKLVAAKNSQKQSKNSQHRSKNSQQQQNLAAAAAATATVTKIPSSSQKLPAVAKIPNSSKLVATAN